MPPQQDASTDHGRRPTSRGRLRRSAQALVRVGAVLLAVSLVVVLVGGFTTRSMIDNLRTNSAELLDGSATVTLTAGAERALYVTGGLVAPGEELPTPVEDIRCTVTGPDGEVPVGHLADDGQRVGLDNPLARFQVVGSFRAAQAGPHTIDCDGLGVVVAPEVSPAGALLRLGALSLGSLGTFAGVTLLLIGGILLLVVRHGTDDEDDDGYAVGDGAEPPSEGADEWWEDEAGGTAATRDDDRPRTGEREVVVHLDDDYVDLSDEELSALTEEQIDELVASGALVFVDEDGEVTQGDEPFDQESQNDTYR